MPKEIHTLVSVTRAKPDGGHESGYLFLRAQGDGRLKKITHCLPVFPNEVEKARMAAGETIDQIIASYYTEDRQDKTTEDTPVEFRK